MQSSFDPQAPDARNYSRPQVLQSAAGFYIGRVYVDPDTGDEEPGSRDSAYFPTREAAERQLLAE